MQWLLNHFPRLVSMLMSLAQASNLRNRVYAMEDRLDILEVALEDIERINTNSAEPNRLICNVCATVRAHEQRLKNHLVK